MATNDFLPFGTGPGANVITQPTYSSLAARGTGFQSGIAQSAQLNKVWRQSGFMSAMLGQFIADNAGGLNAVDDGNIANLEAAFRLAIQGVTKIKLAANLNLFVSTTGNDANSGLLAGAPFRNINTAIAVGFRNYDFGQNQLIINLAAGTYNESVLVNGLPSGCTGVVIKGDITNPAAYVITVSNGNAVVAQASAILTCQGIQIGASGTSVGPIGVGYGLVASQSFISTDHVILGSCGTAQVSAWYGGVISAGQQPITFTGTNVTGVLATVGSQAWLLNSVINFVGTPSYSNAWASAAFSGSIAIFGGVTFVGSFTGRRFLSSTNSSINTNGAGINAFPGSIAGVADAATGGYYI